MTIPSCAAPDAFHGGRPASTSACSRWLEDHGQVAEHVVDRGMTCAFDREVWDCAATDGAVIVTKDEDFASRRLFASGGPPIIWIRRGNTTRSDLLQWFEPLVPEVLDTLERGESVIEIV